MYVFDQFLEFQNNYFGQFYPILLLIFGYRTCKVLYSDTLEVTSAFNSKKENKKNFGGRN